MSTRKIKDAKDLSTDELIYFKGHAKATYMSDGTTVEDAITQAGTGGGVSEAPVDNKPYIRKDGEWVNMHDQYENEDIAILIMDIMNRESYTITQEEYNKFTTICLPGNIAYAYISYDAMKILRPDTDIVEMSMFGDKGLLFKIINIEGNLIIHANASYRMYQGHLLFALSISPDLTFRIISGYGYITGEGNGTGENYLHIADALITQGPDGDEYSTGVATLISGGDGTKFLSNSGLYETIDVNKLNRSNSYTTATTVASLDVNYENIYVTLTANASLSASATGANYNGRTITAYVYTAAARTITIPTTGNYVSMCGSSFTTKASGWVEFNLTCINGIWHIAKLEQE